MGKETLALWGILSLGLHIVLLLLFPGPGSTPVKGPVFTEVGIVSLSKPSVVQKVRGDNAVAASQARRLSPALPEKKESKKELLPKPQEHPPKVSDVLPQPVVSPLEEPSPIAAEEKPVPQTPVEASIPESSPPQPEEASFIKPAIGDIFAEEVEEVPSDEMPASSVGASAEAPLTEASPAYAQNPKPPYPRLAKQRGWEGEVALKVRVSPEGDVLAVEIERSSGYSVLDRAAIKAVRRWHFSPARRGSTPVVGEVIVPVEFRLEKI